jgi:hypothetical protein
MNSFNHYAYGAIGDWMYRVIAGLNDDPARPGYKHIIVRPQPDGRLTHAAATLETPYGAASSGGSSMAIGCVSQPAFPRTRAQQSIFRAPSSIWCLKVA